MRKKTWFMEKKKNGDYNGYIARDPVMSPHTDNFIVRAKGIPGAIFSRDSTQRSSGTKTFIWKPRTRLVNIWWFSRRACVLQLCTKEQNLYAHKTIERNNKIHNYITTKLLLISTVSKNRSCMRWFPFCQTV